MNEPKNDKWKRVSVHTEWRPESPTQFLFVIPSIGRRAFMTSNESLSNLMSSSSGSLPENFEDNLESLSVRYRCKPSATDFDKT